MNGDRPLERLRRLLESGNRKIDFTRPGARIFLGLAALSVAAAFVAVIWTAFQEWRSAPPPGQEPRLAYVEAVRARIQAATDAAQADRPPQGPKGSLELRILVGPDGRVAAMHIERSSGHAELDDLARRIVSESAPFEPFSSELRLRARVIEFRSTFHFK